MYCYIVVMYGYILYERRARKVKKEILIVKKTPVYQKQDLLVFDIPAPINNPCSSSAPHKLPTAIQQNKNVSLREQLKQYRETKAS